MTVHGGDVARVELRAAEDEGAVRVAVEGRAAAGVANPRADVGAGGELLEVRADRPDRLGGFTLTPDDLAHGVGEVFQRGGHDAFQSTARRESPAADGGGANHRSLPSNC